MNHKTISLTAAISFILLLISSVMLYIVPEGPVAYWSDWSMFGLSKSHWGNLHITVGLLFLIVCVWHLVLNWRRCRSRRSAPQGLGKMTLAQVCSTYGYDLTIKVLETQGLKVASDKTMKEIASDNGIMIHSKCWKLQENPLRNKTND